MSKVVQCWWLLKPKVNMKAMAHGRFLSQSGFHWIGSKMSSLGGTSSGGIASSSCSSPCGSAVLVAYCTPVAVGAALLPRILEVVRRGRPPRPAPPAHRCCCCPGRAARG